MDSVFITYEWFDEVTEAFFKTKHVSVIVLCFKFMNLFTDKFEASQDVREQIAEGCDAIVCTARKVPVMLCFADCVPVVLVAPNGFAVVHSGWKGTIARISAKACQALCEAACCTPKDISAYIGPHILGDEYEVSQELMDRFAVEFACIDAADSRMLDLSAAIRETLVDAGVDVNGIVDTELSTVRQNDRFYSYRNEGGTCGRHAAIGVML